MRSGYRKPFLSALAVLSFSGLGADETMRNEVFGDKLEEMIKKGAGFALVETVFVGEGGESQSGVDGAFDAELFEGDLITQSALQMEVAQKIVSDKEDGDVLFDHLGGLGSQPVHAHCGLEVAKAYLDLPAPGVEGGEGVSGIGLGIGEGGEQMESLAIAIAVPANEADMAQDEGIFKVLPCVLVEFVAQLRLVDADESVAIAGLSFDGLEGAQHLVFDAHEDIGLAVEHGVNKAEVLVIAVGDKDVVRGQLLEQVHDRAGEFTGTVIGDRGLDQGSGIKVKQRGNANEWESATGFGLGGLRKGELIGRGIGGGHGGGVHEANAPSGKTLNFTLMGIEETTQAGVGPRNQGRIETSASLTEGRGRGTAAVLPALVTQGLDAAQGVPKGTLGRTVSEDLSHVGPEGAALTEKTLAPVEGVQFSGRNHGLKEAFQLTQTIVPGSLNLLPQCGQLILSAATAKIVSESR